MNSDGWPSSVAYAPSAPIAQVSALISASPSYSVGVAPVSSMKPPLMANGPDAYDTASPWSPSA